MAAWHNDFVERLNLTQKMRMLSSPEIHMKTCLVVDDSSIVRSLSCCFLETMNFRTVEAEDGREALDVCKNGLPNVVLLDWNMPSMSGIEFLNHLRQLPGGDQPKVVFCTTENRAEHISQALLAGADEYIVKPFDRDILVTKFQKIGLIAW